MEVTLNIYASKFSILGVPSCLIYRPPPEHLLNGGW